MGACCWLERGGGIGDASGWGTWICMLTWSGACVMSWGVHVSCHGVYMCDIMECNVWCHGVYMCDVMECTCVVSWGVYV